MAEGFHLFNALFGIIQRAADILLNRFQRFMDAHSGNRLIQRGNAGPLKTLHSIGGALHDLFAQAVQLFLRLLDFVLQRVHHALHGVFLRRFLGHLCKLDIDRL